MNWSTEDKHFVIDFPISKLKLMSNNPRTISKDQFDKLCESIKTDADYLTSRPILVNWIDDTYVVYAGNQRVRAAKKLGMKEIPCVVQRDIPKEIVEKRMILDNKTFGEFNFDILANEFDLEMLVDCGFRLEELVGSLDDPDAKEESTKSDKEEVEDPEICEKCRQKIKAKRKNG